MGLASDQGAIRKDNFAMKAAWEMGREMVSLIKQGYKFPKEYDLPLYKYVREKYGVPPAPFG